MIEVVEPKEEEEVMWQQVRSCSLFRAQQMARRFSSVPSHLHEPHCAPKHVAVVNAHFISACGGVYVNVTYQAPCSFGVQ